MRLRKKPNLERRLENCSHLLIREPELKRGQWLTEFEGHSALHLELGCGKGRFTVETAMSEPETLVVALEKSAGVIVTALERAAECGLQNALFINAPADNLTEYFGQNEVERIYINFCDPWPAARHAKRRLTAPRFLDLYSGVLSSGGEIHFKTDGNPLFENSLLEFEKHGFEIVEMTRDLHQNGPVGIMTDYERKFHAQGIKINRCVCRIPSTEHSEKRLKGSE